MTSESTKLVVSYSFSLILDTFFLKATCSLFVSTKEYFLFTNVPSTNCFFQVSQKRTRRRRLSSYLTTREAEKSTNSRNPETCLPNFTLFPICRLERECPYGWYTKILCQSGCNFDCRNRTCFSITITHS